MQGIGKQPILFDLSVGAAQSEVFRLHHGSKGCRVKILGASLCGNDTSAATEPSSQMTSGNTSRCVRRQGGMKNTAPKSGVVYIGRVCLASSYLVRLRRASGARPSTATIADAGAGTAWR